MLLGLALLLASVPLVQRAVANLFESQQRRRRLGVCRRSRRVGRREGLLQTLPVPPAAACEPPRRWLAPSFGPRCALRRVQRVEGGGHAGWTGASEGKRHGRACKCAGQRQQRMVTEAAGSVSPPGAGRCVAWAGSAMSGRGTSGEQLLQLSIPFLSCWSLVTSTSRPERFPFHKKSAPAGLVPPSAPTRVTRPASHTSHAAGVRTLTLGLTRESSCSTPRRTLIRDAWLAPLASAARRSSSNRCRRPRQGTRQAARAPVDARRHRLPHRRHKRRHTRRRRPNRAGSSSPTLGPPWQPSEHSALQCRRGAAEVFNLVSWSCAVQCRRGAVPP